MFYVNKLNRRTKLTAVFLVLIFLTSCSGKMISNQVEEKNPLSRVRYWAYQIQDQTRNNNIKKLAASHYGLLVIDQTRSLKDERGYDSKADVTSLKNSSNSRGGKKIVIAYIDIGEAESYRWYWGHGWRIGKPEWIVANDPDGWDENYPVKFWRPEWKRIVKKYIDRIIADGYDGIYLDWLEVYSFKPVVEAARSEDLDTRLELVKFVRDLAKYARAKKPSFILIAQNGAELGDMISYTDVFDGIAQEAIWYDGGGDPDESDKQGDIAIDAEDTRDYITNLKKWKSKGKIIFNVEYATESAKVARSYRLGHKYRYKTYVTTRPLNRLTRTPSH